MISGCRAAPGWTAEGGCPYMREGADVGVRPSTNNFYTSP
jgi:hypothetical protein